MATNTEPELDMIGALARIDVASIDATDIDPTIGPSILFIFMNSWMFRRNVILSMRVISLAFYITNLTA